MTFRDPFKRRKLGPFSASSVGILVVVALIAYLVIKAMSIPRGSLPRELISDGLYAGVSLRYKVTEFHQAHRRLPQPSESASFRIAPSALRSTQSVAWDPVGRMIVITAGEPQPGKRFALYAEERDGALTWTCRSIDLDVKYLPGSCR